MTSHDASVGVLMDRMSEIDKQRRVLSMRQKELEAKVAFATSEKEDLARDAAAMDEEEARLKEELEALTAAEQQAELQVMKLTDDLRRTEEEEVVHGVAAAAEQQTLQSETLSWQEKAKELESLRRVWEEDPAMSSCVAALRAEMERRKALEEEKRLLEEKKTEMTAALEKARTALLSCPLLQSAGAADIVSAVALPSLRSLETAAGAGDADGAAASATAASTKVPAQAHTVEEEMQKAEYEWAQVTARHTLTVSSLQREVAALSSRATELRELLENVQTMRQDIARRAALLHRCLTSGCCLHCNSPS